MLLAAGCLTRELDEGISIHSPRPQIRAAIGCYRLRFHPKESVMKKYGTFAEFYPFYLSQHADRRNRRAHVFGSALGIILALTAVISHIWLLLLAVPFAGYGLAWFGHFVFEKNKPATFQYFRYSLLGDWVMFWQIITGRIPF
jgi:hypothetical protein